MASISYQLYSSRNFDLGDTLAMVSRLGITQVEGYASLYADTDAIRDRLEANALAMPTGHFDFDMVQSNPARCIEIANALGIKRVIVPYLPPEQRPTDADGWQRFGVKLANAGKPIRDAGLSYGWHNHDFEFLALSDGTLPIDYLAEASEEIGFELDLAWIHVAGQDPVTWIERFAGRTLAVHVKDRASAGENIDEDGWADVGHGILDWPSIMLALRAADVPIYIIEHDNPSDHERFATRSLANLKSF